MTLEEWTDIVARMTPKQREAMGYALIAMEQVALGDAYPIESLEFALRHPVDASGLLALFYPA